MTNKEAIKEAKIQIEMYETLIQYNNDFEPKNDNSNYENKIDFLKTAIEALEKQIPASMDLEGDGYADGVMVYDIWICPRCGKHYELEYDYYEFCPNCGQALDWSDDND